MYPLVSFASGYTLTTSSSAPRNLDVRRVAREGLVVPEHQLGELADEDGVDGR